LGGRSARKGIKMRRYFIESCFGMAWSKRPFTLENIKETVRRWEREWQEIRPTQRAVDVAYCTCKDGNFTMSKYCQRCGLLQSPHH